MVSLGILDQRTTIDYMFCRLFVCIFFDVNSHSHSALFKLCNILILNCSLPIKCILQFANCTFTSAHLLCTRQCILCWTSHWMLCYDSTIICHGVFFLGGSTSKYAANSSNEFITNNNNNSFLMQQNPFCATIGIFQLKSNLLDSEHFIVTLDFVCLKRAHIQKRILWLLVKFFRIIVFVEIGARL